MTLRLIVLFSLCFIAKNLFAAHPNDDDLAEKAIVARLALDDAKEARQKAHAAKEAANNRLYQASNALSRCALRVHHDYNSDEYKMETANYNAARKALSNAFDDVQLAHLETGDAESVYAKAYVAYREPTKYASMDVGAAAHRAHEEAVAQRRRELAAAAIPAENHAQIVASSN